MNLRFKIDKLENTRKANIVCDLGEFALQL